jgi:hypothetical protein
MNCNYVRRKSFYLECYYTFIAIFVEDLLQKKLLVPLFVGGMAVASTRRTPKPQHQQNQFRCLEV